MPEVTATEASRRLADLLDGVEHRGERYTIVRRGRVVAELAPVHIGSGSDAKALLRRHELDGQWVEELAVLRHGLAAQERYLTLLLLDTTVLVHRKPSLLDLDGLIHDDDEPAMAAITVAELGGGVEVAGAHDLIIAATARATRRTVVTTDDSGFDDLPGVPVRKPE